MRTALILLMMLGLASIPGSIFPQRNQNPMKVNDFVNHNPTLSHWLNKIQIFDVYSSPWFSAIYILLFISLIGCVLPRSIEHVKAIGKKPPLTPKFLDRMEGFAQLDSPTPGALDTAEKWLKKNRFRVRREAGSISAEKGYSRETGNLLFHLSLVLLLLAVAAGGLFGSKGEAILNVGDRFINTPTSYDNISFAKFQGEGSMSPFSLRVLDFKASYDPTTNAPTDYTLKVAAANPIGSQEVLKTIKVNSPLTYGSTKVYLQANGYSPVVAVRDKSGKLIFEGAVTFLPQDGNLTSIGAIKLPDMVPQIGMVASFLPTADRSPKRGAFSSFPEVLNPKLLVSVWMGNLGLDSGVPQSVYRVDTSKMRRIGLKALGLGEIYNFGEGTLTFEGYKSWVNLQIVDDPGKIYALVGAILAILGLLISLFTRQRRIWIKVDDRVEIAGLAKNGVPGLDEELSSLRQALEKVEG
jgi:cytochrome c biogenesis protein